MSREIPIILASHGPFAQGALACSEMLVGQQDGVAVISVEVDSNVDQLKQTFFDSYDRLNGQDGILIMVDMMGGTPCNLASTLTLSKENVLLYCGFNIPVLLEVLTNRDMSIAELPAYLDDVFPNTFVNMNRVLNGADSSDALEQL
jgi:PTS system mannose-specific IIA component